jgi:hypothetical protein
VAFRKVELSRHCFGHRGLGRRFLGRRGLGFSYDGAGGFGVVGGGLVEQGHASLMNLALGAGDAGICVADCWSESLGCGGLTLASELVTIPAAGRFYREPASKRELFDYSNALQTVSNVKIGSLLR